MIEVIGSIPKKIYVAVSGGLDSMVALSFLLNSNRDIEVLYFNHGTEFSDKAEDFVKDFCKRKNITAHFGRVKREKSKDESLEEYWRNERYSFFSNFSDSKIITCHHLDDCVETWVFTSLHGDGKLIPYCRDNFIRPFLTTKKSTFLRWAKKKEVPFLEDPSNSDQSYMRNYIRHTLLPNAKTVNPGIQKVVKKKVLRMLK